LRGEGRHHTPVESAVEARFSRLGAGRPRFAPLGAIHREWMSITGSSSGEACTTSRSKMGLDELAPLGGRATRWRHRRRLDWLADVPENLASRGRSHPGLRPLANLRFKVSRLPPAVCAATQSMSRMSPPQPPSPDGGLRVEGDTVCHQE